MALRANAASYRQGRRYIGETNYHYRSRWEANYARYLEFLRKHGNIKAWEFEPDTFWFLKIKRGVRSYLPDFKVTMNDDSVEYHEVKGWMDARSKTKIKRMALYHPQVYLKVLDSKWFRKNSRQLSSLIPEWERG